MLQPNEDEEFVVIKAGPPLPIRRPKPLKPSPSNSVVLIPLNLSQNDFNHTNDCPLHQLQIQHEPLYNDITQPQPITCVSSLASVSKIPCKIVTPSSSQALSNLVGGSSGKLTSTSTPTVTPTPTTTTTTPRPRSRSPSLSGTTNFSTSTFTLTKSRPITPYSINVESKVKQYIEDVKKFDKEQKSKKGKLETREKFLSLEDLYQVTTPPEVKKDYSQMEDKLRETLRIIKEKDEVIDKLRESCHDLKLKWADAENRIDEMRFGLGGSQFSPLSGQTQGRRSSFTLHASNSKISNSIQQPKRSSSEINLHPVNTNRATNTEDGCLFLSSPVLQVKDKATETDEVEINRRKSFGVEEMKCERKRRSQNTVTEPDELSPYFDLDLESGESNFDPVLEEKCSNWLEKVQCWKIDPLRNTNLDIKDDSCGDRDSGFRGSAELEQIALNRPPNVGNANPSSSSKDRKSCKTSTTLTSKSTTLQQSKTKSKEPECTIKEIFSETIPTIPHSYEAISIHQPITPLSIQTIAEHFNQKQQQQFTSSMVVAGGSGYGSGGQNASSSLTTPNLVVDEGVFGPASLQFAQPWFTFTGNVNPYSATDYEGFPSFYSSSSSSRLDKHYSSYNSHSGGERQRSRSISMDRLNTFSNDASHHPAHHIGQLSSHCDHRELLSKMDKRFQTLHPLLDSTTDLALRLKEKTENLAKILQETNSSGMNNVMNVYPTNEGFMSSYRFRKSRDKKRMSLS